MALTHVLLFFHLLGAFCFFAGAAVAGTVQLAAIRHEQPSEIHALLRLAPIGAALVGIGGLLTLGFGIALAQHEGTGFSAAWIQASLGLWVASMGLASYGGWTARRAGHLARGLSATWTSGLLLLAIVGLMVWQPAGSGSATRSYSFPIPVRIRRAIAHGFPQLAYLPTRLPPRLHYTSYDGVRGFDFNVWFSSRAGPTAALEYGVVAADCAAQPSPMHSFTVNGVDISWSGTYTDQRAWRCITRGGASIVVSAGRSVEGDANPVAGNRLTPKQHRDALELAQVVAYAEPIP